MNALPKVLLSFSGFNDPYSKGLVGDAQQPGPILSLLSSREFDRLILFKTPLTENHTDMTRDCVAKMFPNCQVGIFNLNLDDPTNYKDILAAIRSQFRTVAEGCDPAEYFVAVASGTPQMHACWLLLCASGEIPARILHVRPPKFVTSERPLVVEIDPSSPIFPVVRAQHIRDDEAGIELDPEIAKQMLGIVGSHQSFANALEIAGMLAPSLVPVLVLGETGTGKELIARYIHRLSGREQHNFIPVNCAAIPEDLVEATLFGHKKGSFTGAVADRQGCFDAADKGTLFLDELGELPLPAQAKLLRVLQDGVVEPVGATRTHKVEVRVIAATNRDLRTMVKQGKFREDLFYRLNVGEVKLPPLRERRADIPQLALIILDRINTSLRYPKRLSTGALLRLQSHDWPGNVRDLENVLERSARLSRSEVLEADDLLITDPVAYADPLEALPTPHEGFSLDEFLGSARKQILLRALEISQGNQSQAARLLGISPQAVHKFLKQSEEVA